MDSWTNQNKSVDFKPHSYQVEGIKWILNHPGCGLFFRPGLGKTAVTLSAYKLLKDKGFVDKLYIIAPLRVCYSVWPNEIQHWQQFVGLTYAILHGKDKDANINKDVDVYIINPDGIQWLADRMKSFGKDVKRMLVIDESTMFKNGTSQRFKILKKYLNLFDRRVILTGTPAPNGLIQLWSQIFLLDKGLRLGKYVTEFKNKYFYPSGFQGYDFKLQHDGERRIYDAINDIVIHKDDDELKLPPKMINDIAIDLDNKSMQLYNGMKKRLIIQYEEMEIKSVNAAVLTNKLRQISNGGIYHEDGTVVHIHDCKTEVVRELYDSLAGRPLLVMYEFHHDLQRLLKEFPDAGVIGSTTTPSDLYITIRMWNSGLVPILLLQPQSGGHGLNLQGGECRDIVWYSMIYDLELYQQANARVIRQGVKYSVTVHHLICKGTIDSNILTVLEGKASVQQSLLDAMLK